MHDRIKSYILSAYSRLIAAQRALPDYVYGTIYKFCHYKYKK